MLLEQTQGTGVDVYTHSEMLPAHAYPAFRKYPNFIGNYGNAWWQQKEEFEAFQGPILMTTNCIVPPKDSYKDRLYTTGAAGWPGCRHIPGDIGQEKDFSPLIAQAKTCPPPKALEQGELVTGFAHHQVLALADQIVAAVQRGAIRKFVVMAGCDGRPSAGATTPTSPRPCPRTPSFSPPAAPSTNTTSWTWATLAAFLGFWTPASAMIPTPWPSSP